MYLLGHVGFTILWAFMIQWNFGIKPMKHKLIIGIGAMFPDLIDKPIGSIFFGKGRWFGHSIIFQSIVLLVMIGLIGRFKLEERYNHPLRLYALLIYLGSVAHMILDQPGLGRDVILWPIYGPVHQGNREDFLLSATNPKVIFSETIGLLILCTIGWKEKWSRLEWKVLFGVSMSYIFLLVTFYLLLVA